MKKNEVKRLNSFNIMRRFTLFELLVVIAIIAILAGMLLQELATVRTWGTRTLCSSNGKQLAMQQLQYANGNNEQGSSGHEYSRFYGLGKLETLLPDSLKSLGCPDAVKRVEEVNKEKVKNSAVHAQEKAEILPINNGFFCTGDAAIPYGWNFQPHLKDHVSDSFQLVTADDGTKSINLVGRDRYVHFYYNDSVFLFENHSNVEICIEGSGKGQACCGIYCYLNENKFLRCIKKNFDLSQNFKRKFTFQNTDGNTVYIRIFAGVLPNSNIHIRKITARKVMAVSKDSDILDDFQNITGWTSRRTPPRLLIQDENPAMEITLPYETAKKFFDVDDVSPFKGSAGIRFRVKNNGGKFCLPVALSGYGSNSKWRYQAVVPVDNTSCTEPWQTITLYWHDFVPPMGVSDPVLPSGIGSVIFGDGWDLTHCNQKIEPFQIVIDDLEIVRDPAAVKTERSVPDQKKSFQDVIEKMAAGQPVHIICCGDSITAGNGVKSPDTNRYGVLLQKSLQQIFKNPGISVEVVAVGGTATYNLRVWAKRDFLHKKPDLVTIHVGYNDKSQLCSVDYFQKSLSDFIDRVLIETEGSPAFLLMPTIPGLGARYTMMDDYADAVRALARERRITCYDLARDFKQMDEAVFRSCFGDMAHPNNIGHIFIAEKLSAFFASFLKK